ncbi:MAG: LD-carboxypeptidase [Deltaproteobacteria bacterium]|nr:LD-carboxypeptidase [Deltaproteobacteria bacterium]
MTVPPLKAPALQVGDCLGIFAPASPVRLEYVRKGQEYLALSGFAQREGPALFQRSHHVAGDWRSRLLDFEGLLVDSAVKGLVAARGGYGCLPLLPHLDFALIARHPKIILGFSDLTALQLALWRKLKLITFSGPMLAVEMARPEMVNTPLLWALLTGAAESVSGSLLSTYLAAAKIEGLRLRKFSGRALGGTLTLLASLAGSDYMPDFKDKIIFLEDRGESLYRLDRALTQLRLAGVFAAPAAVVCGDFSLPNETERPLLPAFLKAFFGEDDFPVVINFNYGHCPQSFILPQGVMMEFDCRRKAIALLERAVADGG